MMRTSMSEPISHIATGATGQQWCDTCLTGGRMVTLVYALAQSGPVHIATIDVCITCDLSRWRCRYCGDELPLDGAVTFAHVRDRHGHP